MNRTSTGRGQSGLDRLLVFLLAVVAIVFVTPYVLGFVGVDVRAPTTDSTGGPAYEADHDLQILGIRGGDVDSARSSIGSVRVIVSPAAGQEPVDLTETSAVLIGDGTYDLAPSSAPRSNADGTYGLSDADSGDSIRILEEPTDRAVLTFDLGTDDVLDVGEVGERLQTGRRATLTIVDDDGRSLTRKITVPERLPRGETVTL